MNSGSLLGNPTSLFISIVFSMIGLVYFRYGKKQREVSWLVSGIILMVFPYFVENTVYMILTGICLAFTPVILNKIS